MALSSLFDCNLNEKRSTGIHTGGASLVTNLCNVYVLDPYRDKAHTLTE